MKLTLQNSANGLVGVAIVAFIALGISGGPNYGGGRSKTVASIPGVYSGMLTAIPCSTTTSSDAALKTTPTPTPALTGRCGANSVGIFSLTMPRTGGGTGTIVVFDEGQAYNGTIRATANPKKATINGLLDGTFNFSEQVITGTTVTTDSNGRTTTTYTYGTQTFAAHAVGNIDASVKAASGVTTTAGGAILSLKGTADVQFSLAVNAPFDDIAYSVNGYKQSDL